MTREAFTAIVREHAGSDLEATLILRAADEFAAHMIERHARTPETASDRAIKQARAAVAEEIAKSIETMLNPAPVGECADVACLECVQNAQIREDATTARRIGQTQLHLTRAAS